MVLQCPLDLVTPPDLYRHHGEVIDFFSELQELHQLSQHNLTQEATKCKKAADSKCREVDFTQGKLVWFYPTKERLLL